MTLSEDRIAALLEPYMEGVAIVPTELYTQLGVYLDLLLRWNARTNLTAIRNPEEIVQRHFGESLFAGAHLAPSASADSTLLDFGSGAGFPGLPIQLLLPSLKVALAESQGKKASFLREAVRTLGLRTEVWSGRVEALPSSRLFDIVTLRAVDNMDLALTVASSRVAATGTLAVLAGSSVPQLPATERFPVPLASATFLYIVKMFHVEHPG